MLSIIIPALNEEEYLPLLLNSIEKQKPGSCEIILTDAGSIDKTVKIAKEYGCRVILGGLPAYGRNQGAKIAKGDCLLFLDADVILPEGFFEKGLAEFDERNLDIASFRLIPTPKEKFSSSAVNIFYNRPIVLLENYLPHAAMGILVKKELFEKLGGFGEDIKLAEDHDLARRATKLFSTKFGIIRATEIFVSDRRFKKDGWLRTGIKFFLAELHSIFLGPVKSDIFKYKFGHYKDKKVKPKNKF